MEQVVANILRHDGMRYLKVIGDAEIDPAKYLSACIVVDCVREKVKWSMDQDRDLGIFTFEATWPIFEPFDFANNSPKRFRRFMVVNYCYADRVSDCIKLGVNAFSAGTMFFPKLAYVRDLPNGAEDGMEVHGVILIESEIAPSNCVLIGGMG